MYHLLNDRDTQKIYLNESTGAKKIALRQLNKPSHSPCGRGKRARVASALSLVFR